MQPLDDWEDSIESSLDEFLNRAIAQYGALKVYQACRKFYIYWRRDCPDWKFVASPPTIVNIYEVARDLKDIYTRSHECQVANETKIAEWIECLLMGYDYD